MGIEEWMGGNPAKIAYKKKRSPRMLNKKERDMIKNGIYFIS